MAKCSKCEGEGLTILQSSGRQLCRLCGWSSTKHINEAKDPGDSNSKTEPSIHSELFSPSSNTSINETEDTKTNSPLKYLTTFSNNGTGITLFTIGIIIMIGGLGMDTTVCSKEGYLFESCTHNIGKLNTRSNIVNAGGFIAVCGAVLARKTNKYSDT